MPSSNTPYQVTVDRALIRAFPQFDGLAWVAAYAPKPNKVCLKFADKQEAVDLAEAMRAEDIKVFTNWIG